DVRHCSPSLHDALPILSATQALDLLRPLEPAASVKLAYDRIRQEVPFAEEDRVFSQDIEAILKMIRSGDLLRAAKPATENLEWRSEEHTSELQSRENLV